MSSPSPSSISAGFGIGKSWSSIRTQGQENGFLPMLVDYIASSIPNVECLAHLNCQLAHRGLCADTRKTAVADVGTQLLTEFTESCLERGCSRENLATGIGKALSDSGRVDLAMDFRHQVEVSSCCLLTMTFAFWPNAIPNFHQRLLFCLACARAYQRF